jgi:hypothetical protein
MIAPVLTIIATAFAELAITYKKLGILRDVPR